MTLPSIILGLMVRKTSVNCIRSMWLYQESQKSVEKLYKHADLIAN